MSQLEESLMQQIADAKDRFWSKVQIESPDQCWPWVGCRTVEGYGMIRIGGKTFRSHRIAHVLALGAIPEGMCVLHRCDNPACVNPFHLLSGTHKENIEDMNAKGRQVSPRGVRNGSAKLTPDQVLRIRELYNQGISQRRIGAMFSVSRPVISDIVKGHTWGWVKEAVR